MNPPRPLVRLAPALLLAAGLAGGPLCAPALAGDQANQAPAQPAAAPERPGDAQPPQAPAQPLIDVDFPGGALTAYIAALRKAAGDAPVNAVFSDVAAKLPLHAIELHQVTVGAALEAIEAAHTGEFVVFVNPVADSTQTGAMIYRIEVAGKSGRPSPPKQSTHVFQIPAGDGAAPTEESLAAAEAAAALAGGEQAEAVLRFHEGTGLLIARGTTEQIAAISETLTLLKRQADLRVEAMRRRAVEGQQRLEGVLDRAREHPALLRQELEAELRLAMMELERAELRVQAAREDLQRTSAVAERGAATSHELRQHQRRLREAELDMGQAATQVDRLRARLDAAREQRPSPGDPQEVERRLEIAQARIGNLQETRRQVQEKIRRIVSRDDPTQDTSGELSRLHAQQSQIEAEAGLLMEEVRALQAALAAQRERSAPEKEQQTAEQREAAVLRERLKQQQSEIDNLRQQLEQAQATIRQLQARLNRGGGQ